MTEKAIAKLSTVIGLIFLVGLCLVDVAFGGWTHVFSEESGVGVTLLARTFWGVGSIGLLVNLFVMWRDMYRSERWSWFIATFFTFFFSALTYYLIKYRKRNAQDI
ncbi:hypothetical protein QWI17_16635 [Gilvimarinus sp. SDUM040013]|uniref:DUF1475 domain-containing protein n=1 Tax=Gilvimarinus gilvus TaxID=3058038 RepID=A0ABU4S5B4_9GAMM|nr:hypothetical protein [Gilvimarinus sp. SDUM040013]MDO3387471.1 hypothetical protein [Gilvimarinus sp. SDUM040013]MDX6851591.1 hypothetical protein [Gilvimarinus sp. SDUM040013]